MKEWIVKLKMNKTATVDGKPADKYMQNMALCQAMDRLIIEIEILERQIETEHAMVEAQRDELHLVHKIVDCAKPLHKRYVELLQVLKADRYFVAGSDCVISNNFKKALEEAEK